MAYRKTLVGHGPEVDELYVRIQTTLLAIPGHAEHYRDLILKARLDYEQAKAGDNSDRASYLGTQLTNIQNEGFKTMAYLPSVETVRVLGEFLTDQRGYTELPPSPTMRQMEIAGRETANAEFAARTLTALPIVDKPPAKEWAIRIEELTPPWLAWYEQIKSGKRTFRFEGDPTEYDLNGPAEKEKLVRIERDRKRDAERALGRDRTESDAESSTTEPLPLGLPMGGILAALGLCVAAGWYVVSRKKSA